MAERKNADWASLIAGVLFVGLGTAFVLRGAGHWGFEAMWVLPVLAIGLGLVAVARALLRSRAEGR